MSSNEKYPVGTRVRVYDDELSPGATGVATGTVRAYGNIIITVELDEDVTPVHPIDAAYLSRWLCDPLELAVLDE